MASSDILTVWTSTKKHVFATVTILVSACIYGHVYESNWFSNGTSLRDCLDLYVYWNVWAQPSKITSVYETGLIDKFYQKSNAMFFQLIENSRVFPVKLEMFRSRPERHETLWLDVYVHVHVLVVILVVFQNCLSVMILVDTLGKKLKTNQSILKINI